MQGLSCYEQTSYGYNFPCLPLSLDIYIYMPKGVTLRQVQVDISCLVRAPRVFFLVRWPMHVLFRSWSEFLFLKLAFTKNIFAQIFVYRHSSPSDSPLCVIPYTPSTLKLHIPNLGNLAYRCLGSFRNVGRAILKRLRGVGFRVLPKVYTTVDGGNLALITISKAILAIPKGISYVLWYKISCTHRRTLSL